jgi:flagellar biosynthesis/type III secretory pathway M-ring protein FliF/YscJ
MTQPKETKMKLILILSAGLLLFTVPAFSELTVEDLEKIRSIVKEEVTESEKGLKAEIVAIKEEVTKSEARMKEYVNVRISEMDKRLNNIFTVVIALVAFIAVVIGVRQLVVAMQRKDIRAQDEKIEAQQKQIEALLQDMETRKQERIVKP